MYPRALKVTIKKTKLDGYVGTYMLTNEKSKGAPNAPVYKLDRRRIFYRPGKGWLLSEKEDMFSGTYFRFTSK